MWRSLHNRRTDRLRDVLNVYGSKRRFTVAQGRGSPRAVPSRSVRFRGVAAPAKPPGQQHQDCARKHAIGSRDMAGTP